MPLAFGVLDGRNTKLENAGQIAKAIEPIIKKSSVSDYQITTSCGLEFLPRQYAIRKLELTAQIAKLLNG
jgi:5-methyltetrahydropteroyltriglutamate--homocysteine methyltransferase